MDCMVEDWSELERRGVLGGVFDLCVCKLQVAVFFAFEVVEVVEVVGWKKKKDVNMDGLCTVFIPLPHF